MEKGILQEQEVALIGNISVIYHIVKKYFIMAEEFLEEMKTHIQPIIQHRDALDHIMQAYEPKIEDSNELSSEIHEERIRQLYEAYNHELRAFYDTADYICLNVRRYVASSLKRVSVKKINLYWSDYIEIKQWMNNLCDQLSQIRTGKRSEMETVKKYCNELDDVIKFYKRYLEEIEPKFRRKINKK